MSRAINVCIIGNHALVRAGLRLLIESHPGIMVVAESANRDQTFQVARENHPDIFVLDLERENELDFLPDFVSTFDGARVLVLTKENDPDTSQRAIVAGAAGV